MTITVVVEAAGRPLQLAKTLPTQLKFEGQTAQQISVAAVKKALAKQHPKLYVERQKLALPDSRAALQDEKTLAEILFDAGQGGSLAAQDHTAGETAHITLSVKDLGPQISWRTVFLVEYVGPLIIHPLVYFYPSVFYRKEFAHSRMQDTVLILTLLHFLKRELETIFVHRFSHATMPLKNIFKNSFHYHVLSGVLLAGAIYGPWYSASALSGTLRSSDTWLKTWIGVFAVAELLNLQSHVILRNLRPAGTKTRAIPYGGLFSLVSCPNYFTEVVAWTAVLAISLSPAAAIFLAASAGQMLIWAIKKHKAYKKEFGAQYPKRNIMIPFIY